MFKTAARRSMKFVGPEVDQNSSADTSNLIVSYIASIMSKKTLSLPLMANLILFVVKNH